MILFFLIKKLKSKQLIFLFIILFSSGSFVKADEGQSGGSNNAPIKYSKKEIKENQNLLADFFDLLQEETLQHYSQEVDDLKRVESCLERESCELLPELQAASQQYRLNALAKHIRTYIYTKRRYDRNKHFTPAKLGYVPVDGAAKVSMTSKTEVGKQEIEDLVHHYKLFKEQTKQTYRTMEETAYKKGQRPEFDSLAQWFQFRLKERESFYNLRISNLVGQYPMLVYLSFSSPHANKKQLLKATRKALKAREKVVRQVANLAKNKKDPLSDKRFELLGFAHILQKALKKLESSEVEKVSSFIQYLQGEMTWYNRLYAIATNFQTLLLASCHLFTFALAPVPHFAVQLVRLGIGLACAAYGAYATGVAVVGATQDIWRQWKYFQTRQFDSEVMQQYATGYFVTLLMAGIYLRGVLPGIITRGATINKIRKAMRRHRRGYKYKSSFMKDSMDLAKRYGKYYGEEIAINEFMFAGGKIKGSVDAVKGAIFKAMNSSFSRRFNILTYTDTVGAVSRSL